MKERMSNFKCRLKDIGLCEQFNNNEEINCEACKDSGDCYGCTGGRTNNNKEQCENCNLLYI